MFHESQLRNILKKINFQGEKTKKKIKNMNRNILYPKDEAEEN